MSCHIVSAAVADMYVDGITDARNAMYTAFFSQEKAAKMKEYAETKLPFYLEKYEGFLKKAGGEYLVAGKLTWAGTLFVTFTNNNRSCCL